MKTIQEILEEATKGMTTDEKMAFLDGVKVGMEHAREIFVESK